MCNVNLLVDYVGLRLAQSTPSLCDKRALVGREAYRPIIGGQLASVFRNELAVFAKHFQNRFGWEQRPRLFRCPTIAQWCADQLGKYSPDDVLEILAQKTGLTVSRLKQARIGGGTIPWPYLFDLVAAIEKVTGKPSVILEDYSGFTIPEDASFTDLARVLANA